MAKRMIDVQIEAYGRQYKKNYMSLIPTNIFGENDNYNLINGHVIPSLIHKFYNAHQNNASVEIWGDGTPQREFIYSRDLAKVCLELLSRDDMMPQRLIVPGKELMIRDIVNYLQQIYEFDFKKEIEVKYNTDKPNGQMRRKTDGTLFNSLFPDFQYTDIYYALNQSVDFFLSEYPNVRL